MGRLISLSEGKYYIFHSTRLYIEWMRFKKENNEPTMEDVKRCIFHVED